MLFTNAATMEPSSLSNLIATVQLSDTPFSKVVEYSPVEVTKAYICIRCKRSISLLAIFCALYTMEYNISFFLSSDLLLPNRCSCGSGSVVGIATGYGLDGPGFESHTGSNTFHRASEKGFPAPDL
jgi:hypothetical protein